MYQIQDLFHGVNGTALGGRLPDIGPAWVQVAVGYVIESNTLVQNVDNPQAHIQFRARVAQLEMVYDLNGCAVGNGVGFDFSDDTEDNDYPWFQAGTGNVQVPITVASVGSSIQVTSSNPAFFPPTGVHTVRVLAGPDRFQVYLDGAKIIDVPRMIAKSVPLTRVTLSGGALAAAPSPIIHSLTVSS